MSRKFATNKDFKFISKINKELIQDIISQEVIYYSISIEHTVQDDLYNESVEKVWFSPVRINALIDYDNSTVTSTNLTQDSKYELVVNFHTDELVDRNVKPKEGDFLEFGQIVFEITSITKPQLAFGQFNQRILTKCVCVPSREGQMRIHSDTFRNIENTHPVNDSEC